MTNFQSFAGGAVWMAIAAVLMLATFEPVSIEQSRTPTAPQVTAQTSATSTNVAI